MRPEPNENRPLALSRLMNRRLAPGRLMNRRPPSAERGLRPVLGGYGPNRTKTGRWR
jgi:hypothetical protein